MTNYSADQKTKRGGGGWLHRLLKNVGHSHFLQTGRCTSLPLMWLINIISEVSIITQLRSNSVKGVQLYIALYSERVLCSEQGSRTKPWPQKALEQNLGIRRLQSKTLASEGSKARPWPQKALSKTLTSEGSRAKPWPQKAPKTLASEGSKQSLGLRRLQSKTLASEGSRVKPWPQKALEQNLGLRRLQAKPWPQKVPEQNIGLRRL